MFVSNFQPHIGKRSSNWEHLSCECHFLQNLLRNIYPLASVTVKGKNLLYNNVKEKMKKLMNKYEMNLANKSLRDYKNMRMILIYTQKGPKKIEPSNSKFFNLKKKKKIIT